MTPTRRETARERPRKGSPAYDVLLIQLALKAGAKLKVNCLPCMVIPYRDCDGVAKSAECILNRLTRKRRTGK